MPQAGVAARARRRNVVPWWEELDSEAFREFRAATIDEPTPPAVPFSPEPESDLHLERPVTWAPRADNGRRTVQITGRGAERNLPVARPIGRPTLRRHERAGFKPDRTAMWAVLLGLLLIIVAATSALPH